ncbi:hypothetical protein F3Y22_tig00116971pilonHSYRG00286 [Hibiscus syriacus]|uniref:Uncharacterized protein n=1 Tax=Hibiscus syriacus TaxID=106335 RepID=A0A6A2WS21_HIBSY|nr:hypothetical protein F3Y22_tig00116971pilonHSYRG00286 [Hibiscus syriacus]
MPPPTSVFIATLSREHSEWLGEERIDDGQLEMQLLLLGMNLESMLMTTKLKPVQLFVIVSRTWLHFIQVLAYNSFRCYAHLFNDEEVPPPWLPAHAYVVILCDMEENLDKENTCFLDLLLLLMMMSQNIWFPLSSETELGLEEPQLSAASKRRFLAKDEWESLGSWRWSRERAKRRGGSGAWESEMVNSKSEEEDEEKEREGDEGSVWDLEPTFSLLFPTIVFQSLSLA